MKHTQLVFLLSLALAAQTAAEKTLGAAQHKEEAEGDVAGAIAGYKKAIAQAGKNRALGANAQLRLGLALEKLGDANARAAYELLVRDFGDQTAEVAQARARLAVLGVARVAGGITQRTLLRDPVYPGEPSSSGRYLPFVKGNALYVFDRRSNASRKLVTTAPVGNTGPFEYSCFSADEKWVAYNSMDLRTGAAPQIRIVGMDGSGDRLLFTDSSLNLAWLGSWAPDGKTIAGITLGRNSGAIALVFLDVATGAVRRRVALHAFSDVAWSPDGAWVAIGSRWTNGQIRILRVENGEPLEVTAEPGKVELAGWLADGRVVFASDRSGTRDLYALAIANGKATGDPVVLKKDLGTTATLRVTRQGDVFGSAEQQTMPILEAEIDTEQGVVVRSAKAVATRFTNANNGAAYSPDGKQLAFVSGAPGNRETGIYIRTLATGETRRLPGAAATLPKWYPDGGALLALVPKQERSDRAFYRLDIGTGQTSKISSGPIAPDGATNPTISPDGRYLYFKSRAALEKADAGQTVLRRNELEAGTETTVYTSLESGAEMRLFSLSPDGKQVLLSLRTREDQDYLATMPAEGGPLTTVYSYPKGQLSRAWGGMWWTADGKSILFHLVKGDRDELMIMRLGGGTPKKLMETGIIHSGASHPDNRRIVMQTAESTSEVWVIEGLTRQ